MKKENIKNDEILGKLLYFSLSSPLIEKEQMEKICKNLNFPFVDGLRTSPANAFKNATGDIFERIANKKGIYKVYCKDNKRTDKSVISRELIKETLGENTNKHQKLANINFNRKRSAKPCQFFGIFQRIVHMVKHQVFQCNTLFGFIVKIIKRF